MRAVFFDRDNTLTRDEGYCHLVSDFAWMPEADLALARLHEAGIPVFIITNQGGIALEIFTSAQMQAFHDHLTAQAIKAGGKITDIAHCPHHPNTLTAGMAGCACRKPQAGLFYELAKTWNIQLSQSVMIGDRDSDVQAGQNAGCHSYLYDPKTSLDRLVKQVIATHFTDSGLHTQ